MEPKIKTKQFLNHLYYSIHLISTIHFHLLLILSLFVAKWEDIYYLFILIKSYWIALNESIWQILDWSLFHWWLITKISISSRNGLVLIWRQAIFWSNTDKDWLLEESSAICGLTNEKENHITNPFNFFGMTLLNLTKSFVYFYLFIFGVGNFVWNLEIIVSRNKNLYPWDVQIFV